jgi:hypothetical protein
MRRRGDIVKTCKNNVFTRFLHVRACAHDAKIDRKSFRTRVSTESRDASSSKVAFSYFGASKWSPEGSLGRLWALLSGSWGALGRSWALLGRSWGALGALLGALGRSWNALGTLLGRSWDALGRFLTFLDDLGWIFGTPRVDFGASGYRF